MDVTASRGSGVVHEWAEVAAVVAGGAAVICLTLAAIGFAVLGPRSVSASPEPVPAVDIEGGLVEIGIAGDVDGGGRWPGEGPLTSRAFLPAVTFHVRTMAAGDRPELCAWRTSARAIELGHRMACVDEVWLVRPFAIDCGIVDDAPDAATLIRAMLARPGLGAVDLGPIEPGVTVPSGLFVDPPPGRVLEVVGEGPFAGRARDPDHCRLLPDPASDDAIIEIRRDLTARFVLFDVDGELVVLRAGFAGHDRLSGRAGFERGYGRFDPASMDHLLETIYAISFD